MARTWISVLGVTLALSSAATAQRSSPAQRLLERVRDAYRGTPEFVESGPIEVLSTTRSSADASSVRRHLSFAVSRSADGFRILLVGSDLRLSLWQDPAGQIFRTGGDGPLLVEAIETVLRSELPAGVAVGVPAIAILMNVNLAIDPESLTLGGEDACGESHCDRLLGRAGGHNFRWWVDRADGRVRKSEVEIADGRSGRLLHVDLRSGSVDLRSGDGVEPELVEAVTFGEVIHVDLASAVVRVGKAGGGNPIPGLGPEHFEVRVDGQRVRIEAVDFVAGGSTAHFAQPPKGAAPRVRFVENYPPRLVTFFFQADLDQSRLRGQVRFRPEVSQLLGALHDQDWASVVSFDSRFRLRQDFTRDRTLVAAAAEEAIFRSQSKSLGSVSPTGPSVLRGVDERSVRKIANPASAVERIADSMAGWEGEKILVFVGFGLGEHYAHLQRMRAALTRSDLTVWVLDITEANYHSLEGELRRVALDTGGTYQKTVLLPGDAARRLANRLSAYYVVYFERPDLPRDRRYPISVKLDEDTVEDSWIFQQTKTIF